MKIQSKNNLDKLLKKLNEEGSINMKKAYIFIFFMILQLISVKVYMAKADSPLWARMLSPKYRNAIYPTMGDPEVIKIRIKIELSQSDLNQAMIDVILHRNGNIIKNWQFSNLESNDILEVPVSDVTFEYTRSGPYVKDDNPYEFKLELKRGSSSLDIDTLEFHKYPPPPAGVSEVRIDDNDNVLINGEPVFLSGPYFYENNAEVHSLLKNWGFNAVRGTLNNYDLWVFVGLAKRYMTLGDISTMRSRVQSYRENPQTVAYYLADEPNEDNVDADVLKVLYQMAKEEDPYHPGGWVGVLASHYGADKVKAEIIEYTDCADFIGPDPYPCLTDFTGLRAVGYQFEYLHDPSKGASAFEHIDIPAWGVPQMHAYGIWRWPEPQEERNMVYQFIAGGAKSLIPYKYYGTNSLWQYWGDVLNPELKSIEPAIFASMKSGTSLPSYLFPEIEVLVQTSDPEILVWSYRQAEDKEYLFLINTSNKWNKPANNSTYAPKDKIISVELTFNEPGGSAVQALIKDSNMPQSFSLSGNKLTLQLDGVNENSTGVLVLERNRDTQVPQTPKANFNAFPMTGFPPLEVQFNNLSSGDITSYNWNFGDGSTSDAHSPSHIFLVPGDYTITLSVSGPNGSDVETKVDYINVSSSGSTDMAAIKCSVSMIVDGNLNEFVNANSVSFVDNSGRSGGNDNSATAKVMWDDTNLYIGVEISDTKLNSIVNENDNISLYTDDCIEIFIDPDSDGGSSMLSDDYRYTVNLNEKVLDGNGFTGWGWDGSIIRKVSTRGTVNNNNDTDIKYILEVAIPWTDLGITPVTGEILGLQIGITDLDEERGYEYFGWPIANSSFNNPDEWAKVKIVEATSQLTAAINLSDPSPTKAGSHTVTLITTRNVVNIPTPLIFEESDGTTTTINLTGLVPGIIFAGTFVIDKNVADGIGNFSLLPGSLEDEQGNFGNMIISGASVKIDQAAPAKPAGLIATNE